MFIIQKYMIGEKKKKQAGAELCQAQVKLGLANIEIILYLIKSY